MNRVCLTALFGSGSIYTPWFFLFLLVERWRLLRGKRLNNSILNIEVTMTSDKMGKGVGALLVLLGIVVILTPWIIFPAGEMQGLFPKTSMGRISP